MTNVKDGLLKECYASKYRLMSLKMKWGLTHTSLFCTRAKNSH